MKSSFLSLSAEPYLLIFDEGGPKPSPCLPILHHSPGRVGGHSDDGWSWIRGNKLGQGLLLGNKVIVPSEPYIQSCLLSNPGCIETNIYLSRPIMKQIASGESISKLKSPRILSSSPPRSFAYRDERTIICLGSVSRLPGEGIRGGARCRG